MHKVESVFRFGRCCV